MTERRFTRRDFLKRFSAGSLALLFPPLLAGQPDANRESLPNIVIIFTDDQGYGDIEPNGAEDFQTPNINRMAEEGMNFTSFYVAAPVCTPSRAALMTGSYPKRVSLAYRVLFPFSQAGLNPEEITIPEILKQKNYTTACIGKWHLGHHEPFLPTRQGFDYYYGIPYSNDMGNVPYNRQDMDYDRSPPLPIMRNETVIEQAPAQASLTGRYTREAVKYIEEHADRPFFLYLAHSMPHLPIDASEKFKGKSDHGLYGDVIMEIDWSVGEILDTLKKQGIDENTLVIFTSDNGPVIRPRERLGHRAGSAGPLRGSKNTTWEGGMREPCIMRWPGNIPAGRACDELTTTMDLLPTFTKLVGGWLPTDRIIDGKDIWPLMTGQPGATSPHEAFYYYRDDRLQAVRSGQWKLHVYRPEWEPNFRHGVYEPLLYDLENDIGETTNVAHKYPEVVKRLQALAEKARSDMGDAATDRKGSNVRPIGHLDS